MSDNLQNYNVIYDINVRANDGAKQITELASAMKTLITNSGQVESAIKNIGKIHESLNAIMGKTNKITRMSRGSFDASKGIASLDAVSQKMKRTADNYDKIMSKMSAGARNIASEHTKSINQASKILTVFNRTTRTAKKNLDEISSKEHTIRVNANKAIEDLRTLISLAQQYKAAMKYKSSVSPAATPSKTKSTTTKSQIIASQPTNAPPYQPFEVRGGFKRFVQSTLQGNNANRGIFPINTPIIPNGYQKLIPSLPFGVTGNRFLMRATLDTSQVTGRISQLSREIASRPITIPIYPRMMGYGGASNGPKMIAGTSGWTMGTRRGSYRTVNIDDAEIIPNRGRGSVSGSVSGSGRPGSRGPSDVNRGVSAMYRLSGGISPFPSMRNMPFMYMLNGYMLYSIMTRQIQEAVQYANTMETAKSILKTHDPDLGTFEQRFTDLAQVVRNIGIKTKFTSYQVADATRYLSMAGLNVEQIKSAMPAVSNLALIGDNDLGTIADYVTNIITGYGIGNQHMSNTADVIAYTTASSNTNILEMAEAFKMAAGSMSLARVPFEEAAAAIGVLGNAGIKATMAGTSLRAIIVRIVKPTREAMKALNELKVSFTEMEVGEDGVKRSRVKSLNKIFDDLANARGGRGATLAQLQTIFGKIAGNAAMGLLSHRSELSNLTAGNFSSSGTADKLALVKQNTVQGKWDQVTSAFTENFTKTFDKLSPQILELLNNLVDKLSKPSVAEGILNLGKKLLWFANVVGNGIGWALEHLNGLINTFVGFQIFKYTVGLAGWIGNLSMLFNLFRGGQVALAATETAVGLSKMGNALMILEAYKGGGWAASLTGLTSNAGMVAGGIMLIVGALGALSYSIYSVYKQNKALDDFREKIAEMEKNTYSYPAIDALTASFSRSYEKSKALLQNMDEVEKRAKLKDLIPEELRPGTFGAVPVRRYALIENTLKGEIFSAVDKLYHKKSTQWQNRYHQLIKSGLSHQEASSKVQEEMRQDPDFGNRTSKKLPISNVLGNFYSNSGLKPYETDHGMTRYFTSELDKLENTPLSDVMSDPSVGQFVSTQAYNKIMSMMPSLTNAMLSGNSNETQKFFKDKFSSPDLEKNKKKFANAFEFRGGNIMMGGKSLPTLTGKTASLYDNLKLNKKTGEYEWDSSKFATKEKNDSELAAWRRKVLDIRDGLIGGKIDPLLPALTEESTNNMFKALGFGTKLFGSISANPNAIDADNGWGNNPGADLGKNNYSGSGKLSASAPRQVIVNIGNLMSIDTIKLLASEAGQSPEMQSLKAEMKTALLEILKDVSQDMYS